MHNLTAPIDPVLVLGTMRLDPRVDPQTPASWPPRPASTGLRPTCVAGHVCHFCLLVTQLNLISIRWPSHSSSPVASPRPFRRGLAALGFVSCKVMLFLGLFCKKWWLLSKCGRIRSSGGSVIFSLGRLFHENSRLFCEHGYFDLQSRIFPSETSLHCEKSWLHYKKSGLQIKIRGYS